MLPYREIVLVKTPPVEKMPTVKELTDVSYNIFAATYEPGTFLQEFIFKLELRMAITNKLYFSNITSGAATKAKKRYEFAQAIIEAVKEIKWRDLEAEKAFKSNKSYVTLEAKVEAYNSHLKTLLTEASNNERKFYLLR